MFVPLFSTRSCTNKWVTVQYWCIDAEPQGESQGVYSQPRQGAGHLCLENKHSRCYTRHTHRCHVQRQQQPTAAANDSNALAGSDACKTSTGTQNRNPHTPSSCRRTDRPGNQLLLELGSGQRAAQTTSWTLLRLCLQLDGARVWPMRTSCTPSSSAGALRQTVSTQSVAAPKNACRQLKRDAGRHRRCWGC